MLTKAITYTDYNNNERTENFNFHLTEAELMEMELSFKGGLSETINRIVSTQDGPALVKIFKDLILKAYGVKDLDGRRFIKNEQVREEFSQTPAFSILFMELATDADKAAEFVNGIMPSSVDIEEAKKLMEANK